MKNTTHTGPIRGLDYNGLQPNLLSSGAVNGEVCQFPALLVFAVPVVSHTDSMFCLFQLVDLHLGPELTREAILARREVTEVG